MFFMYGMAEFEATVSQTFQLALQASLFVGRYYNGVAVYMVAAILAARAYRYLL